MTDTARPHTQRPASLPWWDTASFGGLLALVVWAPLPLGGNRPWAVGLMVCAVWLLLAMRLLGASVGGHARFRGQLAAAAVPLALLAAFALLVAGQLLAPQALAAGLQTLDAFKTRIYLLNILAFLGAWALVVASVNTAQRATQLLGAVVVAGLLQAVIAVVLYAGQGSYQFLFLDFQHGGRATGTYPNPDHLAGYMQLCLSAGLGLLLAQFGGEASNHADWRQRTVNTLTFLLSTKMLLRLMLVVMVVALVMTHSRMGNGAFFLALLLIGSVVAAVSNRLRKPALWLVASMALVDVFIIGQWVGLDRVVERLQDTAQSSAADSAANNVALGITPPPKREESIQDRMRVPGMSMPLVWQQPWFGHGGGTYFLTFPNIKPVGFPHHWDHAHNDYVELAHDTGLVGLGLLLALASTTGWKALRLLRDSQGRLKRGVGAAALMALSCMGLHSMVDFNLQIPANALTLLLLMALVWATPAAGGAQASQARSGRQPTPPNVGNTAPDF